MNLLFLILNLILDGLLIFLVYRIYKYIKQKLEMMEYDSLLSVVIDKNEYTYVMVFIHCIDI